MHQNLRHLSTRHHRIAHLRLPESRPRASWECGPTPSACSWRRRAPVSTKHNVDTHDQVCMTPCSVNPSRCWRALACIACKRCTCSAKSVLMYLPRRKTRQLQFHLLVISCCIFATGCPTQNMQTTARLRSAPRSQPFGMLLRQLRTMDKRRF